MIYTILGIAFLFVALPTLAYFVQLWVLSWNRRNVAALNKLEHQANEEYTKKRYESEFKEYYSHTRDLFKEKMKSKKMDRSKVLKFKRILDKNLGSYKDNYKEFKFENDAHEIYVKLKDIHLDGGDFEDMINYLNSLG